MSNEAGTAVGPADVVQDAVRLAALRATRLLDSAAEPAFDRLTRLAVRLVGVPAAFFSLVDETRDFYKSACGFGEPLASARELTGPTFCQYAIRSREPLVIPDTAADPLYRDVPTVRTLGVAAYVGVPIVVDDQVIGSFCVIDAVPRAWTSGEIEVLVELAASAEREIGLRAATEAAERFAGQLQEQAVELETQQVELEHQLEEANAIAEEAQALSEELRESSEALEAERRRLADVFARAPSFLAVLRGPRHVFSLVNDAYYKLVGRRDLVGRPLVEALPEVAAQGFVDLLDAVLASGEPFIGREVAVVLQPAEGAEGEAGEERFLDFVYLPLVEHGELTGVIAHGSDVTASVHARREVERLLEESERARADAEHARAEAEQAHRTQAAFLGTMSHEFRTPLNAIGGYAQLLQLEIGGPLTPMQRDHLRRLTASNTHMLGLINDVLDLAKLDARMLEVREEAADVDTAITSALDMVAPQASARGVRLVGEPTGCAMPYVGDEQRVRQIVVNLLSNAIKFSTSGSEVRTRCSSVAEAPATGRLSGGPWTVIAVRDQGVGIAPEFQAAVFEPFKQVDSERTRTKGGTGLGLAISRRLARLMGGELTLESVAGAGSTFTVWLPATADGTGSGADRDTLDDSRAASAARIRQPHGLAELGHRLRGELDAVLDAWTARLRADGGFPLAGALPAAELEDHMLPTLANVAQTLVVIERTGGLESALLNDSAAIERVTAECHGRQRRRLGWTEQQVAREYNFLSEELAARLRRYAPPDSEDTQLAVGIVWRMLAHARTASIDAFRKS